MDLSRCGHGILLALRMHGEAAYRLREPRPGAHTRHLHHFVQTASTLEPDLLVLDDRNLWVVTETAVGPAILVGMLPRGAYGPGILGDPSPFDESRRLDLHGEACIRNDAHP